MAGKNTKQIYRWKWPKGEEELWKAFKKITGTGIPWQFSSYDSVVSLLGSIPGQGTKILQAAQGGQNQKEKKGGQMASQVVLVVKNQPASAGDIRDPGLIPGSGRSPGGGHGNPLQYSCWRIPGTQEPGGLQSIVSQRDLTEAT